LPSPRLSSDCALCLCPRLCPLTRFRCFSRGSADTDQDNGARPRRRQASSGIREPFPAASQQWLFWREGSRLPLMSDGPALEAPIAVPAGAGRPGDEVMSDEKKTDRWDVPHRTECRAPPLRSTTGCRVPTCGASGRGRCGLTASWRKRWRTAEKLGQTRPASSPPDPIATDASVFFQAHALAGESMAVVARGLNAPPTMDAISARARRPPRVRPSRACASALLAELKQSRRDSPEALIHVSPVHSRATSRASPPTTTRDQDRRASSHEGGDDPSGRTMRPTATHERKLCFPR